MNYVAIVGDKFLEAKAIGPLTHLQVADVLLLFPDNITILPLETIKENEHGPART